MAGRLNFVADLVIIAVLVAILTFLVLMAAVGAERNPWPDFDGTFNLFAKVASAEPQETPTFRRAPAYRPAPRSQPRATARERRRHVSRFERYCSRAGKDHHSWMRIGGRKRFC